MPLAAAQDGLFPKAFAQVSGTRKTPVVGLVASSVLLSGLMAMNYQSSLTDTFTKIIILATLTTLVPYAFAAAAQLMLMFTDRERFSGRRLALDATIAILAFAYSFWMIYGAGEEYIAQGFLLLMAGIPVYVFMRWRQSKAVAGRDTAAGCDAAGADVQGRAASGSARTLTRPYRRSGGVESDLHPAASCAWKSTVRFGHSPMPRRRRARTLAT